MKLLYQEDIQIYFGPFFDPGRSFRLCHKKSFSKNQKLNFPGKIYEIRKKVLQNMIVYFKDIKKFAADHFFIGIISFV